MNIVVYYSIPLICSTKRAPAKIHVDLIIDLTWLFIHFLPGPMKPMDFELWLSSWTQQLHNFEIIKISGETLR